MTVFLHEYKYVDNNISVTYEEHAFLFGEN